VKAKGLPDHENGQAFGQPVARWTAGWIILGELVEPGGDQQLHHPEPRTGSWRDRSDRTLRRLDAIAGIVVAVWRAAVRRECPHLRQLHGQRQHSRQLDELAVL